MKIFVSSVIRGFGEYRDAAVRAAKALRHDVKRSEDFTASSATPQQACLAGVRWAEAVVLILGARYGERQPSGLSATHEEYREARERGSVLVFVENGVTYEPAQQEFLREVGGWTTGHYTASFSESEELRDAVTAALRDLELSRATGPVDEGEIVGRAQTLLRETRHHSQGVILRVVVAGGPRQQVLRPRELESRELEEDVTREALFGAFRVLDRTAGTRHSIRDDALVIEQDRGSILIDQLGSVRLVLLTERPRARRDVASMTSGIAIREDVEESLQRALRFVASILDRIDPVRRISDVVTGVSLNGAMTWRTRAEHERSPNTFAIRMSDEPATAFLTPARRHRAALSQDTPAMAEDLAALLERKMEP
jgi:hypothetical protein